MKPEPTLEKRKLKFWEKNKTELKNVGAETIVDVDGKGVQIKDLIAAHNAKTMSSAMNISDDTTIEIDGKEVKISELKNSYRELQNADDKKEEEDEEAKKKKAENEADEDPALVELRESVRTLTRDLRQARKETMEAEARAQNADARYNAAGDIMRALVDGDKRERILAVRRQWPQLTGSAIAVITQSAPSYVSEVMSEVDHA